VQASQVLGVIGASGYGASAYMGTRARVGFFASENWTNTANGTFLTFNTTANGAATPGGSERMRIDNAGNVGIGTISPVGKLDVAGHINTSTQYNIAGNRVLSVTGSNLSGGGPDLVSSNTFVGVDAGLSNSPASSGITPSGNYNSFFGEGAGKNNSLGLGNSYFGNSAGKFLDASNNSFFGLGAGSQAGGSGNAYFGSNAGNSIIGDNNTAVGGGAGGTTFLGNGVTLIGSGTTSPSGNFTNATAIGANAMIMQSNSLILGNNANVGIGTSSPVARLNVVGSGGSGQGIQFDNREIKFRGEGDAHYSIFANRIAGTLTIEDTSSALNMNTAGTVLLAITKGSGNVGLGGVTAPTSKLQVNGQGRFSTVNIDSYVAGQTLPLCTASSGGNQNLIGLCNSSSLRYKTNVNLFRSGLNLISRLRPISYDWKESGVRDVGLAAEEVEKVEPLLTFRNSKGEIEGVRYDRLGVVFVNAIKEQQAQLEHQQKLIEQLQSRLTRLEINRRKRSGLSTPRSRLNNTRGSN
jgi:hypothetical protein